MPRSNSARREWVLFTLTLLTIFVATWLRNSWLNGYALAVMTKSQLICVAYVVEL